jgi:hypothetical protein
VDKRQQARSYAVVRPALAGEWPLAFTANQKYTTLCRPYGPALSEATLTGYLYRAVGD